MNFFTVGGWIAFGNNTSINFDCHSFLGKTTFNTAKPAISTYYN